MRTDSTANSPVIGVNVLDDAGGRLLATSRDECFVYDLVKGTNMYNIASPRGKVASYLYGSQTVMFAAGQSACAFHAL